MKHTTLALFLSLFVIGCAPLESTGVGDDGGIAPDAQTPGPDAGPPRITDINPPLVPDDPCRQLKMTFPSPVVMADAARLGPHLYVAYMLETGGSGVLVYEDDILLNSWPLPGSRPWLYYERDSVHAVSAGVRYRLASDTAPVSEMKTPNPIVERWDMASVVTGEGDNGFGWVNTDGISLVTRVSVNDEFDQEQRDREATYYAAGVGFWHERIGDGRDAAVRMVVGAAAGSGAAHGLGFRTIDVNVATGNDVLQGFTQGQPLSEQIGYMSLVMDGLQSVVVARDEGPWPDSRVVYSRYDISDRPGYVVLRSLSGATLATRGAQIVEADGSVRTMFVEQVWTEDLMSSTWQLVDPAMNEPLAIGRAGHASDQRLLGTLLARGGKAMWAGPTLQDGSPSNYSADAIAVCEVDVTRIAAME